MRFLYNERWTCSLVNTNTRVQDKLGWLCLGLFLRHIQGGIVMKKIGLMFVVFTLCLTTLLPVSLFAEDENAFFALMDQIITAETNYGLTGAQVAVTHKGSLVKSSSYGFTNNYKNVYDENNQSILDAVDVLPKSERVAVTKDTLFDLASNTKMYSAVYAVQHLISEGELSLDTKIADIFVGYEYPGYGLDQQHNITVGNLLRHDAGYTPDPQYHNNNYQSNNVVMDPSFEGENLLYSQERAKTLEMMLKTPVLTETGSAVKYSDVDFMMLGAVVEKVTGQRLDDYVNSVFYEPLNLTHITFNPLDNGFQLADVVSSELHGNTRDGVIDFNNVRTEVVTGEVHDEKAFYSMEGVSGHAGLFSNAEDIAMLATAMTNGGTYNGVHLFSQDTIDSFNVGHDANDTYGFGWRRKGANGGYNWAFSEYSGPNTIGHTGWTGTVTVIDPDNDVTLALLTNARNTPIMGPGANDFYTKNFNTNDYGLVADLTFLGLGYGEKITAHEYLVRKIKAEISNFTEESTSSKGNAVRALLSVLQTRAKTDADAKAFLQTDAIQDVIQTAGLHAIEDSAFLKVNPLETTALQTQIEALIAFDSSEKSSEIQDAATALNAQVLEITGNQELEQPAVDALATEIATFLEAAADGRLPVSYSALEEVLTEAKAIDSSKYTTESYSKLEAAINAGEKILLQRAPATQQEVNQAVQNIQTAMDNLVPITNGTDDNDSKPSTNNKLPETGLPDMRIAFIIGISIFAMSTLLVVKRYRKE